MSRYAQLRRRVAPVAFAAGIALIAYDTCEKEERTRATFVLDFGAAARDVRGVDAELWMSGERVLHFRRVALDGMHLPTPRFDGAMPGRDGELRIEVDLGGGDQRRLVRQIRAEEGATITVRLEHELR